MGVYNIDGETLLEKNQWSGKVASFLGDSITAGINTTKRYDQFLNEMIGFSTSNNYGISGSTIAEKSNPMWSRAANIASDSDLVFVFGGTNDFNKAIPIGSFYNEDETGRTFNTDTSTFCGAINRMCDTLLTKFPKGQIVLMTPIHRCVFNTQPSDMQKNNIGLYVEAYVEKIREACDIYSLHMIDLYSDSRLFPQNTANAQLYFHDDTDELHPNAHGHWAIARLIYEKLKNIPYLGDVEEKS